MPLHQKIQEFRQAHQFIGGCVILFGAHIQAWQNALRSPRNWIPGVIAYFEDGSQFRAIGGNANDGAETWQKI